MPCLTARKVAEPPDQRFFVLKLLFYLNFSVQCIQSYWPVMRTLLPTYFIACWRYLKMKFRLFNIMLAVIMATASMALLTAGCDENSDDSNPLFLLTALMNQGPGQKRIFVTDATHNGDFDGIAGADAFCMSDPNKPSGGTWKALIASSGRSRTSNWILQASTQYVRVSDSAVIGTTNSLGVFPSPLTNAIDGSVIAWTGLNDDWSNSTNNCNNWEADSSYDGMAGILNITNNFLAANGNTTCAATLHLVCVEQ